MTSSRDVDRVIDAFFEQRQPELPDRVFDAVRRDIHHTRQAVVIWPWARPNATPLTGVVVAAVVVALVASSIGSRPSSGPGTAPTATPALTPSVSASPSRPEAPPSPTTFTSRLYGYSLRLPPEWAAAPALLRWEGRLQPAFGDPEVDNFGGPAKLAALAFAGPFDGDLDAFVRDRVAANARDHSDTCPPDALEVNEPVDVAGQHGVLLGWNCGALINQALVVRDGMAYAFTFRDLGKPAASDPTDLAIFQSILATVQFAAPGPRAS